MNDDLAMRAAREIAKLIDGNGVEIATLEIVAANIIRRVVIEPMEREADSLRQRSIDAASDCG